MRLRTAKHTAVPAAAVGVALLLVLSGSATANIGTPADGAQGPTVTLSALAQGKVAKGSMITTQTVKVVQVDCPSCVQSAQPFAFWVQDATGTKVRTYWAKYPEFNTKKENWVPKVGWSLVVQGRADTSSSGIPYIDGKRWAMSSHPGPTVHAYDLSAGKYHEGDYVWLAPVKLSQEGSSVLKPDGDYVYDGRDAATGKGFVHLELSAPYYSGSGGIRVPHLGETVQAYGYVHFDPDHNWWEIHPVRCWSSSECVGVTSSYVKNSAGGNGADTSPLSGGGSGGSGGGSGGTGSFTFTVGPNINTWWVEVYVKGPTSSPVTSVSASVNGGSPIALSHTSWGSWAKSFKVSSGSQVVFRAADGAGNTGTSGATTWP